MKNTEKDKRKRTEEEECVTEEGNGKREENKRKYCERQEEKGLSRIFYNRQVDTNIHSYQNLRYATKQQKA